MPVLPTFTANVGNVRPDSGRAASPQDMGAGVAQSTGRLAGAVQNVGNSILAGMENDEARTALVKSAQIRAQYAKELDQAATSGAPIDPIRQQMQNDLAAVGESFVTSHGQEALNMYSANADQSFNSQANAIEVRRASADAKAKGADWLNAQSALLARDPSALAESERQAQAFVGTFTNIPPEQRKLLEQNLQQQLNMSAALAVARSDPAGATKRLTNGEWTLSPAQRQQALKEAEFSARSQKAAEAAAAALAHRQAVADDQTALNAGVDAINAGQPPNLHDPRLSASSKENLWNYQQRHTQELINGAQRSDPSVKRDLWLRINADPTDPNKIVTTGPILEEVQKGKLNTTDAEGLVKLVQANADGQGVPFRERLGKRINAIDTAIRTNPEYATQSDLASEIQNELLAQAEHRANDLRQKGKDPSVMLDPSSPDYFFKPDLIKSVADDLKQRARKKRVADLPVVHNQAEYDQLPAGQPYVDAQDAPGAPPRVKQGEQTRFPIPPRPMNVEALVSQARQQYGFLKNNPDITTIVGGPNPTDSQSETWGIGNNKGRPSQFALDKNYIQVFNPGMKPSDWAAEVFSHIDPRGRAYAKKFLDSLNEDQRNQLKQQAVDFRSTIDNGQPVSAAWRNAAQAAVRGYVFGQWPESSWKWFNFTPAQKKLLDEAKRYAHTGK